MSEKPNQGNKEGSLPSSTISKWWKDETSQSSIINSKLSNFPKEIQTPMSPITPSRNRKHLLDTLNIGTFKSYYVFLISQVPLSNIDEEAYKKDHRAIKMPDFMSTFAFNTLYFYEYSGSGDNKAVKKEISVR